jgi:hypothetical protein
MSRKEELAGAEFGIQQKREKLLQRLLLSKDWRV